MQRYFCQRHLKIALYANACKCLRALFSLLSAWQAHAISRNSNTAALGQILELKGVVIVMTKALASIIYLVCASCYTWLYLAEFPPCQLTRPLLRYSSLSELPTKIKHKNAEPKVWRHAVQSFMLFCLAWQMLHKKRLCHVLMTICIYTCYQHLYIDACMHFQRRHLLDGWQAIFSASRFVCGSDGKVCLRAQVN